MKTTYGGAITDTKKLLKRLFILAFPLIGQNLINVSVGLADNIMVGSLGEYAVAGVALANQVQFILMMLVMGVSAVLVLLSSQYWGKRDTKSIKDVIAIGIKMALGVGILLNTIVALFPMQVLRIFSNDMNAIEQGMIFIRIIAFSYVFFCITQIFMASMRCVEVVRIALVVATSTLIISVTLNYLLIFGNFGFPQLGIMGAAIATLTARIIEAVIMTVYVRFFDNRLRIRFKELLGINIQLLKDFVRHGAPVIGGDVLWGIAISMHTVIFGRMGANALAAQSVTMILFQFVTVVVWGVSGASAVLIGKTVGAGEYDNVKHYARVFQVVFAVLGISTAAVFFGVRDFMISLYEFVPETVQMARQFTNIAAISTMFTAFHAPVFVGIIRAGGDVKFVLKVDGICAWFLVIPSAALAAFVFELPPVWVFFFLRIDQFFKWIIAAIKVNNFSWIMNLTRNETDNST